MNPAEESYNAIYDILVNLFFLYDQACSFEFMEQRKAIWSRCQQSALEQLEDYSEFLTLLEIERSIGVPADPPADDLEWIDLAKIDVSRFVASLGRWSSIKAYADKIHLVEIELLRSMRYLAQINPCDALLCFRAVDRLKKRMKNLDSLAILLEQQIERLAGISTARIV